MSVRQKVRSVTPVRVAVKKLKIYRDSIQDARHAARHLRDGSVDPAGIEYELLVLVHALEKGLSNPAPRAFGEVKAQRIVVCIRQLLIEDGGADQFVVSLSSGVLSTWLDRYRSQGWQESEVHDSVRGILAHLEELGIEQTPAGTVSLPNDLAYQGMGEGSRYGFEKLANSRHSVRSYRPEPVDDLVLRECLSVASRFPSACNRQMVRLRIFDEESKRAALFEYLHGVGGVDSHRGARIGLVTYDARSWETSGERNQGYLNSGLFAMSVVYAFHDRGVGSCLLQFGNSFSEERELCSKLGIPLGERVAVGISFGYPRAETPVPASRRKPVEFFMALSK